MSAATGWMPSPLSRLLGVFRDLRLLRLMRLAGVLRGLVQVDQLTSHHSRARNSLWFMAPAVVLVWAGSAYAFFLLERGANPGVNTFADAPYMSMTTVATIGSAGVRPVTSGGEILSGLLKFASIGLLGVFSAQLAAWLLRPSTGAETSAEIRLLREALSELRRHLEAALPVEKDPADDRPGAESDRD